MTTVEKKRIVIIGLGDAGLLAAVRLSQRYDVTAISTKPSFVSGQELGLRLSNPSGWRQEYLLPFSAYRGMDRTAVVHGKVTAINHTARAVKVRLTDDTETTIHYDALLIASGVSNGFWRNANVQGQHAIDTQLTLNAAQLQGAARIAIVGAGPTGVSSAVNLAKRYPDKAIHLFYSQQQPLNGYHPRVQRQLEDDLRRCHVQLHPGYRANTGADQHPDRLDGGTITFSGNKAKFQADAILWATGNITPNSDYIDQSMLNADGFVTTDRYLRVNGQTHIFAVGDIAATDPYRSSARNGGYQLVSHNIDCLLRHQPSKMQRFCAPRYRWGSIVGVQSDGLTVHSQQGGRFRFPPWAVKGLLFPIVVRRGIYKGVRRQFGREDKPENHSTRSDITR